MIAAAIPQEVARATTNTGRTLLELSNERPTLAVFLRFSGCPFCLEAMHDIKARRAALDARGTAVVFIHMMSEEQARPFFEANGVADLPRISDPDQRLYRALDLKRGNVWQIMGPYVWFRAMQAGRIGKRIGKAVGDMWQMPGVFLLDKGRVTASYRHRSQASRPDYEAIACPARPAATAAAGA